MEQFLLEFIYLAAKKSPGVGGSGELVNALEFLDIHLWYTYVLPERPVHPETRRLLGRPIKIPLDNGLEYMRPNFLLTPRIYKTHRNK